MDEVALEWAVRQGFRFPSGGFTWPPPQVSLKSFRSVAARIINAAGRLRYELRDRRFWVVGDDLDQIEETIASVKGEIAQLKETVTSAR